MMPEEDKALKSKGSAWVMYVGGALAVIGIGGIIFCLVVVLSSVGEEGEESGIAYLLGFGLGAVFLIVLVLGVILSFVGKGQDKKNTSLLGEAHIEHKSVSITKPSSTESIASLILGIFGIFLTLSGIIGIGCPLGLLAIVFGAIALVKLKRNPQLRGRGMAVAGLMLGIIAVIGLILEAVHFSIHV
jgi:hypothetical protein